MAASILTLGNRPENLKLLLDFVQKWSQERNLAAAQRHSLERAARKIFRHLVSHAYPPGQPGSIAAALEEKGPRLRLIFEDDAPPHNPLNFQAPPAAGGAEPPEGNHHLLQLQQVAESLIYYRTPDRKNRLVVFLS
jgi:anti-sigma regulatory factor (Ser/Thr protein kinase)